MKTVITPEIRKLAECIKLLAGQAVNEYGKEVDAIISSHSKDQQHIEHTLDWMLDFCWDERMLVLYKGLCRYYWNINQRATASYINFYREMWDSENPGKSGKRKSNSVSRSARGCRRRCYG
jgi:hypothetical protein